MLAAGEVEEPKKLQGLCSECNKVDDYPGIVFLTTDFKEGTVYWSCKCGGKVYLKKKEEVHE